jgi:hypothetical protein
MNVTINGTDLCEFDFVESAGLSLKAGGPDVLSLTFGARDAASDDLLFSVGDEVAVRVNGELLFDGRILTAGRKAGGGTSEGFSAEGVNGWGDMERVTLEQEKQRWNPDADPPALETVTGPRVVLGQDVDGEQVATGAVFSQIISWAQGKQAKVREGSILTGRLVNQTEVVDVNTAAVLRQFLRFHPDAVAWIDGTKKLHIQALADLDTVSFSKAGECDLVLDAVDRSDRAQAGVKIVYEITNDVDGETLIQEETDSAGSLDSWPPPRVMTIELAGASVSYQKEEIKVRKLPDPAQLTQSYSKNFYKGLFPFLSEADLADLAIQNQVLEARKRFVDGIDAETGEALGTNADGDYSEPTLLDGSGNYVFPNQLVQGAIQPWFPDSIEEHTVTLKAKILYKGDDPRILNKMPTGEISGGVSYRALEVAIPIKVTNAVSKTYQEIDSFEDAQQEPISGLAADYLAAINSQLWEGQISGNIEAENGGDKLFSARPGKRVRVSDFTDEYSAVTDWNLDLKTGACSVRFGISEFLNPKDEIELNNLTNINRPKWSTTAQRTEAKAPAGLGGILGSGGAGNGGDLSAVSTGAGGIDSAWDLIDETDYSADGSPVARLRPGRLLLGYSGTVETVDDPVSAQFTPTVGDSVYLEVAITDLEVTGAEWKVGDFSSLDLVELDGTDQDFARLELWKFVAVDDSSFLLQEGMRFGTVSSGSVTSPVKAVRVCPASGDLRTFDAQVLIDDDVRFVKVIV